MEIIKNFQWIDIVAAIVFIRVVYISTHHGLLNESIKLVGVVFAVFFAVEYYPVFFGTGLGGIKKGILDFSSFLIIFLSVVGAFGLIRRFLSSIFKIEELPRWQVLTSVGFSVIRASIIVGAFIFFLNLTPLKKASFSRSFFYDNFNGSADFVHNGIYQSAKAVGLPINKTGRGETYDEVEQNL